MSSVIKSAAILNTLKQEKVRTLYERTHVKRKYSQQELHELRSKLVITIELAKFHYSLDEISEILGDELQQLLDRPVATILPFRGTKLN